MVNMTLAEFIAGFTWPVIFCLAIGIGLIILEMFTPGFGVAGVLGIVSLILSIVLKARNFTDGLLMTVIIMIIIGALLFIFLRSAIKGSISKSPIILNDAIMKSADYISAQDLAFFIGKQGKTTTILRPSGVADFDGVRLDVVTEGNFIANGSFVRIESIEGRRILVKQIDETTYLEGREHA